MKFLKLGLILSALALFIFACTQAPSTNNSTAANKGPNAAPSNAASNSGNATNAASNAPSNTGGDELASAKKIYTEKCILCHKETGEGGDVDLEGDKFKVPNFKSDKAIKKDDKDFTDMITGGEEKMPAFGKKLKPEEIASLVKYIRHDFQGK